MALASTTLAAAIGASDGYLTVAAATSVAAGRFIIIDQEMLQVTKSYSSGTLVPVLRGVGGTAAAAHVITATVVHGDAADFDSPPVGAVVSYPTIRPVLMYSYTGATNTFVLPPAGCDAIVTLNGTTADTFTIPIPTAEMDGTRIWFKSNGVAQHILTFTGGIGGVGTDNDLVTINATGPFSMCVIASGLVWVAVCGPAISGTTTKIAAVTS